MVERQVRVLLGEGVEQEGCPFWGAKIPLNSKLWEDYLDLDTLATFLNVEWNKVEDTWDPVELSVKLSMIDDCPQILSLDQYSRYMVIASAHFFLNLTDTTNPFAQTTNSPRIK